jgi:hypothetical protein
MDLLLISVTYVKATTGADNAGDQGTNTKYADCTTRTPFSVVAPTAASSWRGFELLQKVLEYLT